MSRQDFEAAISKRLPSEFVKGFMEADVFVGDGENFASLCLWKDRKAIWLSGLLGKGLPMLWAIKRWAKGNGFDWIGFSMREDNPFRDAIERYSRPTMKRTSPDGSFHEYAVSLKTR